MYRCIVRAIRIALFALVSALLYEGTKQAIFSGITIWESHFLAVFFFSGSAFVVSIVMFRKEEQSRSVLLDEIECRRKVEQQLHLQATALEAAANAIVITDRDGAAVWLNPAFSQLTGYNAEEVLGRQILLFEQQDPTLYNDIWQRILSGAVWRGEVSGQRKDSTLYVEELTVTPVRSDGGEITHFIAIKVDATERKRAEESVLRSEATLRSLIQNAPYGISHSTPEGKILSVNPTMCRMLGYASETELMSVTLPAVYRDPMSGCK